MGFFDRFIRPFFRRRNVSLVRTRGPGSERQQEIEEEAAAEVTAMEQDDKYFRQDRSAEEDDL